MDFSIAMRSSRDASDEISPSIASCEVTGAGTEVETEVETGPRIGHAAGRIPRIPTEING